MSKFPALFIGHGSPMNALADNSYTRALSNTAAELPSPNGIVVISAHWHSTETSITGSQSPEQIYDFYGFPEELYRVKYKAPGSPDIAGMVFDAFDHRVHLDERRGIDHAAWAVLKHMYPQQDIPVLELSINDRSDPYTCIEHGKMLRSLRDRNILLIGSGNIVHNLSLIKHDEDSEPFPWVLEFDNMVKELLLKKDFESLADYRKKGDAALKSVPTPDHYLPMLYILGAIDDDDDISFIHESIQNGSVSMRCFMAG